MSGAPTGLTLIPTTSSREKNSLKLFFMLRPVSFVIPCANIAATTAAFTASPSSERLSVTCTTRPGKGPGMACGPFGTFMNSAMLVSTRRRWRRCRRRFLRAGRNAEHQTARHRSPGAEDVKELPPVHAPPAVHGGVGSCHRRLSLPRGRETGRVPRHRLAYAVFAAKVAAAFSLISRTHRARISPPLYRRSMTRSLCPLALVAVRSNPGALAASPFAVWCGSRASGGRPVISTGRLRGVIAATGALLVLLLLNLQFLEARRSAGRRVGIVIDESAAGIAITEVAPGSPAAAAGIRAGDVVRSIAGTPLKRYGEYDEIARGFRRGQPVDYIIARDGLEVAVAVSPGMPVQWSRRLLMAVVVLGYLALALLALAQPQRDLRATLLSGFSLAVALELAVPTNVIGSPLLARLADSAFFLLTGLEIGLELHLVSLIPERHAWLAGRRWVVPAFYVGRPRDRRRARRCRRRGEPRRRLGSARLRAGAAAVQRRRHAGVGDRRLRPAHFPGAARSLAARPPAGGAGALRRAAVGGPDARVGALPDLRRRARRGGSSSSSRRCCSPSRSWCSSPSSAITCSTSSWWCGAAWSTWRSPAPWC